jgi:hypothetical protein
MAAASRVDTFLKPMTIPSLSWPIRGASPGVAAEDIGIKFANPVLLWARGKDRRVISKNYLCHDHFSRG